MGHPVLGTQKESKMAADASEEGGVGADPQHGE